MPGIDHRKLLLRGVAAAAAVAFAGGATILPSRGHAMSGEALRDMMQRFDALVYQRPYTPSDGETERARQSQALALAADDLAGSADAIADSALVLPLDPDARVRFKALSVQLRDRAIAFQRAAASTGDGDLRVEFDALETTCIECHALFRNPLPSIRP